MYTLTQVTRTYHNGRRPVAAVKDVTLAISDGEWLAVQGRTGHGRSTLLQLLGGLDRPTSGTIELDGCDLAQAREAHLTQIRVTTIGFIFQTFNLIPTLSAAENVEAAKTASEPALRSPTVTQSVAVLRSSGQCSCSAQLRHPVLM